MRRIAAFAAAFAVRRNRRPLLLAALAVVGGRDGWRGSVHGRDEHLTSGHVIHFGGPLADQEHLGAADPAGPAADRGRETMMAFQGAIFDVDGVLVDSPHELAWRESFRALMEGEWRQIRDQTTWAPERFTPGVYQQVMAGMPRMAGARAAMEYFGVPDIDARIEQYAAAKQEHVVGLIEKGVERHRRLVSRLVALADSRVEASALLDLCAAASRTMSTSRVNDGCSTPPSISKILPVAPFPGLPLAGLTSSIV